MQIPLSVSIRQQERQCDSLSLHPIGLIHQLKMQAFDDRGTTTLGDPINQKVLR